MAKYIVHRRGVMPESMVIFDEATVHADLAKSMFLSRDDIVSAGRLWYDHVEGMRHPQEQLTVMMGSPSLKVECDAEREERDKALALLLLR